jgi:diguanylate cyclase (GGDEF)-like protein
MRLNHLTIIQRLIFSNLLSLGIVSLAILMVIKSLYSVESILNTQANEHVTVLTENADISRRVFNLTSSVKLLEQTFLFSETTISEESFNIDLQLQKLQELSTNREFSQKMNAFINNFHRFLGSSLALNRILKKSQTIDSQLSQQIDELELYIADKRLLDIQNIDQQGHNSEVDLVSMLREAFLMTGKMVGNIHSRITPETEQVLIIEVEKELDILLLHLENIDIKTSKLDAHKTKMKRTIRKYNAALRRIKANLDQRWIVMDALINSQNELLGMVEQTEIRVQGEAIKLANNLKTEIAESRFNAILTSVFAVFLSIWLVYFVVKKHIRKPLEDLSKGFEGIDSDGVNKPIILNRIDEWSDIEKAFNKMALRLSEAYIDLNEEKKNFNYLAHHDPLTGLANRLLGTQKLNEKILQARAENLSFLLLYLDIDEFKTINDSLGHTSGDNLLISVSKILEELIKDIGVVSRMGGDEFMIIVDDVLNINQGELISERINKHLRKAYYIDDNSVFVSASIGVCKYPEHGIDEETLIRNADTAMYHAKRNGKDQYRIYDDKMTLEVTDLIETNTGLRKAIRNNELVTYFQPKVDLNSKRVTGAEALIRWQHPDLGLLQPAEFLEVAEKTDLIVDIDKWVFKTVAELITKWQEEGVNLEGISFSVNFSGRMFYMPDLAKQLKKIIDTTGCKPNQLVLEITERDMMRDFVTCVKTIEDLRTQGYKIAIDDFGTGYSSLSVVKNLSADYLKLDRSFIQDIGTSKLDYEITNAVLKLAEILDLSVIAEGVETQDHLEKLIQLGCNKAQGYYFSKPLPVKSWLNYLSKTNSVFKETDSQT